MPNLVASLVLSGTAFSFMFFEDKTNKSRNQWAAILKNVIITSRQVIIVPDYVFLYQSEHRNLYIHLCNYTNIEY